MSKKYLIGSMNRKLKDRRDGKTKKLQGSLDQCTFRTSLSTRYIKLNRNVCISWLAEMKFNLKH